MDTWAQVLLPKLIEQGSAADLALTCSQLRDLCYSSSQSIDLGPLPDSTGPSNLKLWVRDLPVHFPNCSTVLVGLRSDSSYHCMPYILPALARWVCLRQSESFVRCTLVAEASLSTRRPIPDVAEYSILTNQQHQHNHNVLPPPQFCQLLHVLDRGVLPY